MIQHDSRAVMDDTHMVRSADGTPISYLSVGKGPSVLVVPGVLSMASDYGNFADALGEHFTVYTIERRGARQERTAGG